MKCVIIIHSILEGIKMRKIIKLLYNIFFKKRDKKAADRYFENFMHTRGKRKRPYRLISKKGLKELNKSEKYFVAFITITDGKTTITKQFPLTPGDMLPNRIVNIGDYCLRMCLAHWSTSENPNMWSPPPFRNKKESRRVFNVCRGAKGMEDLEKEVEHIVPIIKRL